jgi:hypothetical protein
MKAYLVLLAAVTLGAAAPATRQVDMTLVRGDLRKLVSAEETYYSDHSSYTSNLSLLKLTVNDSVSIKFTEFSANAYSAAGTLKGIDGVSCVLMIGHVATLPKTAKGKAAEAEGGVMCDE